MGAFDQLEVKPPQHTYSDLQESLVLLYESDVTDNTAFGVPSALTDVIGTEGFQNAAQRTVVSHGNGRDLVLGFVGKGADNATAFGRVWGTRAIRERRGTRGRAIQTMPFLVAAFDLLLSARTGVAGTSKGDPVLDTAYRYVDTITLTDDRTLGTNAIGKLGPGSGSVGATTPDDTPQFLKIDGLGWQSFLIELRIGTATGINALAAWL